MTTLKCSAVTCVYNDNQLCSKGDILVTGENARLSSETSCESFRKRVNTHRTAQAAAVAVAKFTLTAKPATAPIMTNTNVQHLQSE